MFENHCPASNINPASYDATTLAMIKLIKPRKYQSSGLTKGEQRGTSAPGRSTFGAPN